MIRPGDIETEMNGLTLRRLTAGDADDYFRVLDRNRAHLSQFRDQTATKYPTLESVEASIKEHPLRNVDNGNVKTRLGIWNNDDFVGSINITDLDDVAEIGYWLGEEYTGRGFVTCAVRGLTDFAKRHYETVFATVYEGNYASSRVLGRAGYIWSKTLKIDGHTIDLYKADDR